VLVGCVYWWLLQVPSKVLVACSRLLAERSSTVHKLIAVRAASTVLRLAYIPNSNSNSSSSNGSIITTLSQQLEPSGLLQQLPQLLTFTAQQLEAQGPAAAAAATEAITHDHSSSGSSAASLLTQSLELAADTHHLLRRVDFVMPDLLLYTPVGRACVLPLARVAINTLRALGSVLTAHSTPSSREQHWLEHAITGARLVLVTVLNWTTHNTNGSGGSSSSGGGGGGGISSTPPIVQEWLQSPYPLQCMCFLVVARALHQQAGTQSSNDRGSSSSSSSSCGNCAAAATSAAAASRQQQPRHSQEQQGQQEWLPCCVAARVPRPYAALLDAIGCSREVALWTAHTFSPGIDSDHHIVDVVSGYYTQYVYAWMQRRGLKQPEQQLHSFEFSTAAERQQMLQQYIAPAAKQQQQQQQQQGAYQEEPLALHLWLSVSLLQWAGDMPSSTPCFTLCCLTAAESATRFWKLSTCELAFEQVWMHTLTAQQQQQQQPDFSVPVLPEAACREAHTLSCRLLHKLLQLWREDLQATPGTTPPPNSTPAAQPAGSDQGGGSSSSRADGSSSTGAAGADSGGQEAAAAAAAAATGDLVSTGRQHEAAFGPAKPGGACVRMMVEVAMIFATQLSRHAVSKSQAATAARAAAAAASGEDTATVSLAAGVDHHTESVAAAVVAATTAAGDVCAVLEAVVRTELTAAAQPVNDGTSSSSNTCGDNGKDAGMLSYSLRSLPDYILEEDAPGWRVGPLVDPVVWLIGVNLSPAPSRRQQQRQEHQKQLYGLLFSALKLVTGGPQHGPAAVLYRGVSSRCINPICQAASNIITAGLQRLQRRQQQQQQQADSQHWQEGVCNRPPGKETAASAAAATTSSSTLAGSNPAAADSITTNFAADMLPCLTILGRCCLCCAEQMQQPQEDAHWEVLMLYTCECCLKAAVCSVRALLSSSTVVKQLDLLGYRDVTRHLTQQLETVEGFLMRLTEQQQRSGASVICYRDQGARETARQQHQALGSTLTCFAVPLACNNPDCKNVSGTREAQLVGGRSCICGGCRTARYCSKACQSQHWKQHKPVCRALAAAAAAARGSNASSGSGQVRC